MAPIKEFSSADLNTISRLSGVSNVLVKVNGATVAASSFTGLLDTYTGAAAAYSVRKLDKDYTGYCMRIVVDSAATVGTLDSSDPEFDIGFDTNGDLDTAEIVTRCNNPSGTNYNAYVTKWYDQSGNSNDAAQTTHANMPQIAAAGAVITENGKPTLKEGSTSTYGLSSTFSSSISQPVSIYSTHVDLSTNNFHEGITNDLALRGHGGAYRMRGDDNVDLVLSSPSRATLLNSQVLIYMLYDGANSEIAANGNTASTGTVDTNGTSGFNLRSHNIRRQEFLVFEADNTNRTAIETNINNYYSIY